MRLARCVVRAVAIVVAGMCSPLGAGEAPALTYDSFEPPQRCTACHKEIARDGDVPDGCRIFRRPFFDPQGRMTICQWHTAKNTDIDYRIGPRETKIERYAVAVPKDAAAGELTVRARLLYSQIPSSLGRFMQLPAEEYAPILVNEAAITINIEKE